MLELQGLFHLIPRVRNAIGGKKIYAQGTSSTRMTAVLSGTAKPPPNCNWGSKMPSVLLGAKMPSVLLSLHMFGCS